MIIIIYYLIPTYYYYYKPYRAFKEINHKDNKTITILGTRIYSYSRSKICFTYVLQCRYIVHTRIIYGVWTITAKPFDTTSINWSLTTRASYTFSWSILKCLSLLNLDCCDIRGQDRCGFACPKCPIKVDQYGRPIERTTTPKPPTSPQPNLAALAALRNQAQGQRPTPDLAALAALRAQFQSQGTTRTFLVELCY